MLLLALPRPDSNTRQPSAATRVLICVMALSWYPMKLRSTKVICAPGGGGHGMLCGAWHIYVWCMAVWCIVWWMMARLRELEVGRGVDVVQREGQLRDGWSRASFAISSGSL